MRHPRIRTTFRRASLAVLLLPLAASVGCGSSTSEPKVTPTPPAKVPVRVVIVTPPKTTAAPTEFAGQLIVRVENAAGGGVAGVHVKFSANGSTFKFGPTDTTSTDSSGTALTYVSFGTTAGPDQLQATAVGVAMPALMDVVVKPGAPVYVSTSVRDVKLFQAGDSVTFQAEVLDAWRNTIPNAPFDFRVSDPTLLSVTPPPTQGGLGVVRALKSSGSATITATTVDTFNAMFVTVFPSPRNACAGFAAPQDLAFGALTTVPDSAICLGPTPTGAEYALITYNESTDGAASLGTSVTAYNVEPAGLTAPIWLGSAQPRARAATLLQRGSAPTLNLHFHERLLERSRSLRTLFAPARATRTFARAGGVGRLTGARLSYSAAGAAATVPAVNDLIALNVAEASCSNADMRTFRVEAVGDKSLVLADTANPAGGFTRADYDRFAARFDTLVLPLDASAFGNPTDIDGNGRVAILFTRAVNELTPANSGSYVGGFFHPRDLFPRVQSPTLGVCATSNEGEMVYMMVPDPTGVVNGNQFRLGMVDTLTTSILAHELQHLINASRRMYVNTAAQGFEETWLNEGLSHIAEELLYFRESGFAPRSRLTSQSVIDTWEHFSPWVSDDASNFTRFYLYLLDPGNHSPIDAGDELETRGATWAFLRYAVDRSFTSDLGVWQRFANSTTSGIGTLNVGLQRDPKPLLRDFAVSNMTSDHPSWDYSSVYSRVFNGGKYPLTLTSLQDGVAAMVSAKGGSASYQKFRVPAGAQTLLRIGSAAAPRDGNLTFTVVQIARF